MQTLANILAGTSGNPYQTPQGISPLLAQFLASQYAQQPANAGMAPPQTGAPPTGQGYVPPAMSLGGMGTATGAY